ncbi:hypothetical protein [Chryseobacterium wanjuense]
MKKYFLLFLMLVFIRGFAQNIDIKSVLKVTYNASLQLGEKFKCNQQFILIGNSQDYYFSGNNNYLSDTNQNDKSTKKVGLVFHQETT